MTTRKSVWAKGTFEVARLALRQIRRLQHGSYIRYFSFLWRVRFPCMYGSGDRFADQSYVPTTGLRSYGSRVEGSWGSWGTACTTAQEIWSVYSKELRTPQNVTDILLACLRDYSTAKMEARGTRICRPRHLKVFRDRFVGRRRK